MNGLQDTDKQEYLRAHLEERYAVRVMGLHRLDKGVFSVDLHDGRRWIARVFPARRSLEQVEGDASILQFLEKHRFPAERALDTDPVSVLYGRGILVTEYIEGTNPGSSRRTLNACGELLARLHLLPAEDSTVTREAGALHHYVPGGGGPQNDLVAASSWLAAIEDRVSKETRTLYESLREQVASADTCQNLPQALIHPDPVLKNILDDTGSNDLVFIDWTGAGRGPRLASLAVLIWSGALRKGGWSAQHVDAVVAGYRSHIRLEEDELVRLADVMRLRPLVFACWRYRYALISEHLPDGTEWWWPDDELPQAIAARACTAFRS